MLSEALFLYHALGSNYLDWYYSFYPQGHQLQKKNLKIQENPTIRITTQEVIYKLYHSIQTSFFALLTQRNKVRNIYINSTFNLLVHTTHIVCVQAEGEMLMSQSFIRMTFF